MKTMMMSMMQMYMLKNVTRFQFVCRLFKCAIAGEKSSAFFVRLECYK